MYNLDYTPIQKVRTKSNTGVIILTFIIITSIILSSFAFIYRDATGKYDAQLAARDAELQALQEKVDSLSTQTSAVINTATQTNDTFNFNIPSIAQKVSPSVIGIQVTVPSSSLSSYWRSSSDYSASGSGIIISSDGYIATNYHVIEYCVLYKNVILEVTLSDGTLYTAKYIGGDEINDLAVIKIDAKNLTAATLGSSKNSKVGDFVIAIGNPLGSNLYGSVTFGIISGLDRKVEAENVAEQLIQTDAAINPGNSGGALINSKGEVIGINTIKISDTDVEGIGFAIPMEYAKPILESLQKHGYVKGRASLGISGSELSKNVARYYGVPQGVLITEVSDAASTLKKDDIITAINDTAVLTSLEINTIIKTKSPSDIVKVTVWRDKKSVIVDVKLIELQN